MTTAARSAWNGSVVLSAVLAACAGRTASRPPAGSEKAPTATTQFDAGDAEEMKIARSGDEYDWTSMAHPACPGDSHLRWDPARAAARKEAGVGDAGANDADAGDAGVSKPQVANAAAVVSAMRAPFRKCYQELLDRTHGEAEGRVRLTFHVNCDGYVSWIHGDSAGLDESAIRCIFQVGRDARFDPPEGGSAEVNVPVNLMRADRPAH